MMRNGSVVVFILLAVLVLPLQGQEQLGMRLSNYSGVNGMLFNPAHNLTSGMPWDVNLVSAYGFVENNYMFIENASIPEVLRYREDPTWIPAFDAENPNNLEPGEFIIDFRDNGRRRYADVHSGITGPSFMVNLPSGHTFGFFTGLRFAATAQNIPNVLSYYKYDGKPFYLPFNIDPFESALLGWGEIGLNYGLKLPTNRDGVFGFGLNLKFLQGLEGAYFESLLPVDLTKLPGDTITSNVASLRYGYTNSNTDGGDFSPAFNGIGIGVDLGIVYAQGEVGDTYQWKFGASILDVGGIRFNKNAQRHQTVINKDVFVPSAEYEFNGITSLDTVVWQFSEDALGNQNASFAGSDFQIFLPTALSLQFDYAFTEQIFVNATLVQRIPVPGIAPQRSNILALTPRFEHRWFEASLPISFYNYGHLRVGLAARLGPLILGVDNLAGYFGEVEELSGGDLYLGLKVPFFEIARGANHRVRGKAPRCYSF